MEERWEDYTQKFLPHLGLARLVKFAETSYGLNLRSSTLCDVLDSRDESEVKKLKILKIWKQPIESDEKAIAKLEAAYENFKNHENNTGRIAPLMPSISLSMRKQWNFLQNLFCPLMLLVVLVLTTYFFLQTPQLSVYRDGEEREDFCNLVEKVNQETKRNSVSAKQFEFAKIETVNFREIPYISEEYIPERFGLQSADESDATANIEEIFRDSNERQSRLISLIGPPGSGKTEFLKQISNEVLAGKLPSLKHIEIVRYLNLPQIDKENLSLYELIFGWNTSINYTCQSYFKRSGRKLLLILDDVDQFVHNISSSVTTELSNIHISLKTILVSIFSGDLLPRAKIIISSRAQALNELKGRMRPCKIIKISGMSKNSVTKSYSKIYERQNSVALCNYLASSASLFKTVKNPMLLQLLHSTMTHHPETLVQVILHTLLNRSAIDPVALGTLKKISFLKIQKGKITFTEEDITNLAISPQIMINRLKETSLIKGHNEYHFVHQLIQEVLSALYIAEMDIQKFQEFMDEIYKPRWTGIRRTVTEIVFKNSTFRIAKKLFRSDGLDKKRKTLQQSLKTELNALQVNASRKPEYLELLHVLNDSDAATDDILNTSLHEMNFVNLKLTKQDLKALHYALSHKKKMRLINLISCGFDKEIIRGLADTITKHNIKVQFLTLGNYQELGEEDVEQILRIMPYVGDLLWLGYRLNDTSIKRIRENKEKYQLPDKVYIWSKKTKRIVIIG